MKNADGRARAWGWVSHLREGGTTAWAQWRTPAEASATDVPGAQQLELLRRINLAGAAKVEAQLVERVLRADAPGRGLPDLELVGAARDDRFGTPPVDPADLPSAEILRSTAHLLAQDLARWGPVRRPAVRPRRLRRARVLLGDPWLRSELARELTALGRAPAPAPISASTPPSTSGGRVVIVGTDLPRMLGDAWTHACFERPVGPWHEWLAHWGPGRGLPSGVDLDQIVDRSIEAVGARRVEVVLDGPDLDGPDLARSLGVRSLSPVRRPGRTAAELARLIASSLCLVAPAAQRSALLRDGFLPRLPDDLFDVDLPQLPAEAVAWVSERDARMSEQLARAGYPVGRVQHPHDAVTVRPHPTSDSDGALDLAVRLLLGGWKCQ